VLDSRDLDDSRLSARRNRDHHDNQQQRFEHLRTVRYVPGIFGGKCFGSLSLLRRRERRMGDRLTPAPQIDEFRARINATRGILSCEWSTELQRFQRLFCPDGGSCPRTAPPGARRKAPVTAHACAPGGAAPSSYQCGAAMLGLRLRMYFERHVAVRVPSGSLSARCPSWSSERDLQRRPVNAVPARWPMPWRLPRPTPPDWRAVPPRAERGRRVSGAEPRQAARQST